MVSKGSARGVGKDELCFPPSHHLSRLLRSRFPLSVLRVGRAIPASKEIGKTGYESEKAALSWNIHCTPPGVAIRSAKLSPSSLASRG